MNIFQKSLKDNDKVMYNLLKKEEERQNEKLILNAAISITPKSVMEIQGSIFDNIDAEGYIPKYINDASIEELEDIEKQLDLYKKYKDNRPNKCCEYANIVEALAQKRLAKAFENEDTKNKEIFVNLQVPTGAIANYIVYNALLEDNDIILSLGVNDGGHTTHGNMINISGKKYRIINYHINMEKENIDYDEIADLLSRNKPKLLISGASSFPLNIDWKRLRLLINKNSKDTLLMADIAHTAGLVAGKAFNNPIGIADVTTLVTYKTFCGPRAAAIISTDIEIAKKIDETVFPNFMGSPLLLGIAGVAVASNIALTKEYTKMQHKIVENSRYLCIQLLKLNIPVVYRTSDSHIVLLDCSSFGKSEKIVNLLEDCNILTNSCIVPSINGYHEGIRLGTTWITQKNITKDGLEKIAIIIAKILKSFKTKKHINVIEIKNEIMKLDIGGFNNDNF